MDIIEFLEEHDIEYYTEGKNISPGWVGIQCPFCDDQSNHAGVSPDATKFSCWKCGESGKLYRLIAELIDVDNSTAWNIAKTIGQDTLGSTYVSSESTTASTLDRPVKGVLPKSSTSEFPKIHKRYIASRRFGLKHLKREYKIKAVHTIGRYRFRIIIPYFLDGELINYIARDVTGRSEKKYIACSNSKAVLPIKSTFYNIDRVKRDAIIVEGVTDVWAIGTGAIAASGSLITNEQLVLLKEKGVKKAYLVFDEDAAEKVDRYANKLSAILDVEIVELENGDPAEQEPQVIHEIRGLLL